MPVYASNSRMVIDGEAEDGLYESKPSTDAPFHQEMGEEAKQVEEKVWLAVTDKEGDFHVSNLLAFFCWWAQLTIPETFSDPVLTRARAGLYGQTD